MPSANAMIEPTNFKRAVSHEVNVEDVVIYRGSLPLSLSLSELFPLKNPDLNNKDFVHKIPGKKEENEKANQSRENASIGNVKRDRCKQQCILVTTASLSALCSLLVSISLYYSMLQ